MRYKNRRCRLRFFRSFSVGFLRTREHPDCYDYRVEAVRPAHGDVMQAFRQARQYRTGVVERAGEIGGKAVYYSAVHGNFDWITWQISAPDDVYRTAWGYCVRAEL